MRVSAPWLLLLVPLGLWYLQRVHARSYVGPTRAMLFVRIALFVTIVLALTRPEITLPSRRVDVLALVDDSASVLPSRRAAITKMVRELAGANPGAQVWRFGAGAQPASADAPLGAAPQTETHLERALFAAEAALPEGTARRIVLFSDGRETEGDARRAARALGEERIPVYPVRLPAAEDPEVLIAGLRAPEGLRRGEPVEVSMTVRSTTATRARVSLTEGGRVLWEDTVQLKAGDTESRAAITLPTSGLVQLRAEVFPEADTLRENNAAERTIHVEGPPRVLLGTPTLNQISALGDGLMLQGIDVIHFDPTGAPQSLEELGSFDAVILDEIAPGRLDANTQELLEAYVRDLGGGLLFVTGHTGLGTFDRSSALQRMLPLSSEERVENQVPPLAMVLVVDRSGSMEGEKLAWTKRAALGALEELPIDGQMGVIAFDAEFRWIAPLRAVSNKTQLAEEINSLGAGGGTRFYPALESAYYKLAESNAAVKHIVLLTDGLSTDGVDFKPLARQMAGRGITLSTVAMSKEADLPLLKNIAQIAGGRAYTTDKAGEVPRIFVTESKLITKKAEVDRVFRPVQIAPFEPLSRVDFQRAPKLYGFIATSLRPGAELILSVDDAAKGKGDGASGTRPPLLARWRFGLGQVLAFASDTDGTWARDWTAWGEYPRLWSELIRHTMRDKGGGALLVAGKVVDGALEISVDIDEARARAAKDLEVELYAVDAGLVRQKVDVEQTGPGTFRGRLPWSTDGAIVLNARVLQRSQVLAATTRILDRPTAREFTLGDDDDTLASIAQLSGGEVLQAGELGRLSALSARRRVSGAPFLIALALFFFLIDLYIKRVRPTPRHQ